MEYVLQWQIFLRHFKCLMYAITYVISSYLVQRTREVRKVKYCVWARLVKRHHDQYLCTSLSVISITGITGSMPDLSKSSELTHLPLVPHICANVLDSGNGSAWIQVKAGRHIPSAPSNYPNSSWLITNCHKQVSYAKNVRDCHKQVLNNKTVWNWILSVLWYSLPSSHFLCHHQCMGVWLIMNHYSSYFIISMSHNHQYPKHSETVWNW